tara:strand:- start:7933 stop:12003 length:4071 start_codon:yes stop_codon:yes gene_type:complete
MANVTQTIPNYVLGISTQPDEMKAPGQVVDLKNAVPDVVRQCIKRPGSHLVSQITPDTGANAKWFHIYTNESEQYIGQVASDGDVTIWRCSDGVEIPVDYADVAGTNVATYLDNSALSDESSSDIQVSTVNETTFFVNRRKTVAMKTDQNDKSPKLFNEAFVELKTVAYGKQYSLDFATPGDTSEITYKRATAIYCNPTIDTGSVSGYSSNGACSLAAREIAVPGVLNANGTTSATQQIGTNTQVTADNQYGMFDCSPPATGASGKRNLQFAIDLRCVQRQIANDGGSDDFNDSYHPNVSLQFGGEGWDDDDNLDYRMGNDAIVNVFIRSHVQVSCKAGICGVRPAPTSATQNEHVSAASILAGIKTTLDGIRKAATGEYGTQGIGAHGIAATIAGNGIHFHRDDPFVATTSEKELMNIITSEANNISELPRVCRHGYTVKILNSGDDQDDYYLRFQAAGVTNDSITGRSDGVDIVQHGTYTRSSDDVTITATGHGLENDDYVIVMFTSPSSGAPRGGIYQVSSKSTDYFHLHHADIGDGTIDNTPDDSCTFSKFLWGEGVWEEVAAPDTEVEFDNTTMPLKLTRVLPGTFSINGGGSTTYSNGAFRFGYPDWGKREAGDDTTNPKPSFVGNTINKLVFFRNRIGILSGENVILSRPNDFYNFWAKTALTISNADPIDLQSSSLFPTKFYDAVEVNSGLAIFSASEQFLLSSGAEALLTPETAKISYLSSYAFNSNTRPITLGTTLGFLNSTGKNARYYEMGNISPTTEPLVVEQSKVITKLLPDKITIPTESNENSLVLFAIDGTLDSHTNSKEVWGYKWYQVGENRAQSAWFRWELPNPVVYHTILDDTYYAVLSPNDDPHSGLYTLERFDLKLADDTLLIGTDPDTNRVHLDTKKTITYANLTYDSSNDLTTFTLGDGYNSANTLSVYCTTDSPNIGKSYDVPTKHIDKTFVPGDVNTTANTITILSHGLVEGNPVTFQEGSSALSGLTDNTVYYVVVVDTDTIQLATNRANAVATTPTVISLSGTGAGTHTLETPTVTLPGNWKTSNVSVTSSNVDVDANTITATNHQLVTGSALTYQESYKQAIATSAVNTTADTITFTSHGLSSGDEVYYDDASGTTLAGLSDTTTYFAVKVDANTIKLAASKANAIASTPTIINLTGTGNNSQTLGGIIRGLTDNTTYYAIKVDANTIKLATSTSNASAGTAVDLTNIGSGTHTLEVHTDLIVGYEYEFEVELPKVYLTQLKGEKVRSETRGSLVLHRMNFNFGDVGVIDVTLKRKGRTDYTSTLESKEWNSSATTDEQAISDGYIHTVPIYERNTNLNVHIKSNHPSPATLNSMNWEGDYSPKYYKRV